MSGGTPSHMWIPLLAPGHQPIRVLAATDEEVRLEIERVAGLLGLPPAAIEARPPEQWRVAAYRVD